MKKNLLLLVIALFIPIIGWAAEQGYAVYDSETATLTFKYGVKPAGDNVYDTDYTRFNCYNPPTWDCSKLKKVIFDPSFANARPTSISFWFDMATSLTDIVDIKYLNTSEVKNMWRVFGNCRSLTSLDLSHFDTGKVTRMSEMFSKCTNLKSLDISSFNTSNVELMEMMFCECESLESLDVSRFDTGNVTDMDLMFFGCGSLTSLDVSSFNTSKVENMRAMFCGCGKLTSLDVSRFDTGKISDMSNMFCSCAKLTRLDVSNFNTSNVTDMSWMFRSCKSFKELDLSSFDTGKVTDMSYLFCDCDILESIYVSDKWTIANVTSGDGVFYNCDRLIGGLGTIAHNSEQIDYTYARIDGGEDAPGYLTDIADRIVGDQGYAVFDSETGTLTFMYGEMPDGLNVFHTDNTHYSWDDLPYWDCGQIKKVIFNPSFANARPKSTSCWFMDAYFLSEIVGIEYLNTSDVTDMSCMFENCRILTNLDLRTFDTGNVTDMKSMFSYSGINKINLSHFDTRNVVNMSCLFSNCSGLTSLDLGSFDTGNVTNMEGMFFDCGNLETIYAGDKWSTASVTEGGYVFYNCEKLVGGMGTAYKYAYILYENIDGYTFARIDGGEDAPGYFTKKPDPQVIKISDAKQVAYYSDKNLDFSEMEKLKAYVATGYDKSTGTIWLSRVYDVPANTGFLLVGDADTYEIPVSAKGSSSYYRNMFKGTLEGTTIQTTDGAYTNYYLSDGDDGVGFYKVTKEGGVKLGANRAYLPIPTVIDAVGEAGSTVAISIGGAEQVPYYSDQSLDFTSMEAKGMKAYTATGYDYATGTIWLSRVKQVPAETGVLIMAPKGDYDVPTVSVASVYENMFKGTLTGTTILTEEDGFINYYLSNGAEGVGFYKVTKAEGVALGTNRCYLQIPKVNPSAASRGAEASQIAADLNSYSIGTSETIGIQLLGSTGGNGDGTTNLRKPVNTIGEPDVYYNLQGQRVDNPTKGLYIKNGKKIIVR